MTETKKHVGTSTQPRTFKKLSRLKLAPRKVQAATIQDGESSIEVRSILSTSRSNMTSSSSGSMIGAVRKRHKSEMTSESISCRVTSEQQLGETSEKSVTYDSNNYKKTPRYFIPKLFEIWAPQLCPSYRANVKYVPTKPSSFATVSSLISRLNMPVKFKTAETVVETCVHFQKSKQFGK